MTDKRIWSEQELAAYETKRKGKTSPAPVASKPSRHGRARHTPGRMNKLEEDYAWHLDLQKLAGDIVDWKFESLKFRLADRTWYTPDFFVSIPFTEYTIDPADEIHEVKGHWEDDARVKFKVVAEQFPMFKFRAFKIDNVNGEWVEVT